MGLSAGFFGHFAQTTVSDALARIYEAAGQVKGAASRFKGASQDEKFLIFVENNRHGGGCGIVVIGKSAVGTTFGACVVFKELRRAATGTEFEEVEGMERHKL